MPFQFRCVLVPILIAVSVSTASARTQDSAPPPRPSSGERGFATAELRVPRPAVKPCVVELFGPHEFVGDQPVRFSYSPPFDCTGPWSKVVIEADYDVTAGRQFDRTAIINVGGVNLYFGTTMEPRRDIAPAWHAERDVTDYASFLKQPHDGETLLTNYVDATYTGHIHGSAKLLFYPATAEASTTEQPQFVAPLSAHVAKLSKDQPTLDATLTLPRNIERLELDIINEPQADDEFWYGCLDDRFTIDRKDVCGGGALRETEVFIDGTMAGVAPVYPWIYTGGINPYLWFPIPGVETVNFSPYRVDLTPFAGQLNDGKTHQISIGIVGLRNYAFVTGTLLGWLDPGSQVVTGALTRNTLQPATITVNDRTLKTGRDGLNGRSITRASRDYVISGFLDTSHGRVTTRIRQKIGFINDQHLSATPTVQTWVLKQSTNIVTRVERTSPAGVTKTKTRETFPLDVVDRITSVNGVTHEEIKALQGLARHQSQVDPQGNVGTTYYDVSLRPSLRARIDPKTHTTHPIESGSIESVRAGSSGGLRYARTITSENNTITSVSDRADQSPPKLDR